MTTVRTSWLAACLLLAALSAGCTPLGGRLAGYGCERGPCVIDPRGVPVEPCCDCEPMSPTCCDSDACDQCRETRENFFDSLYALICECNCWPNSECCNTCGQ